MGKIKLNNKVKVTLIVLGIVGLFVSGVTATLGVQRYNDNLKAQGVSAFKANSCDEYAKDGMSWLECDK